MTVRVYRSTDVGAPSIDLSIGSIITLLDACLVNGYGSKAALGWTKQFSGTNKAVYLQGTGGAGNALRVVDDVVNQVGGGVTTACKLHGVRGALTVDTYKGRFGDSVGCFITKPETTGGGGWVLIGNEYSFYLCTKRAGWGNGWSIGYFGDCSSYASDPATDIGKTIFSFPTAQTTVGSPPPSNYDGVIGFISSGSGNSGSPGTRLAGDVGGIYTDANGYGGVMINFALAMGYLKDTILYPSRVSNGLVCSPVMVVIPSSSVLTQPAGYQGDTEIRGVIPGRYIPLHHSSKFTPEPQKQFTFTSGEMAGKTLEAFYSWDYSTSAQGNTNLVLLEVSDTW